MLFYVILGVILVASIACAFLTKEKGEKDRRAKIIAILFNTHSYAFIYNETYSKR